MAADHMASTFITEAAGFIGAELARVLTSRGHQVIGLAPSREIAQRVRQAGATPVVGELLEPGQWQDEAPADWVFHLPSYPTSSRRLTLKRVDSLARDRVLMDANLLDAIASGTTRRIVYVADANWYGARGERSITEDESPRPSGRGRWIAPALDRLDGYIAAGLPIVIAFPGCVYGNGSWFRRRVVEPIMAGRRVVQCGSTGPWVSPIHVHDCARALVHLAEHGEPGGRYFLVNDDPIQTHEFAEMFARLANRPLRLWRLPAAARLLTEPTPTGSVRTDAVFSNIRLRGIGFRFTYPTLERGLEQVLGALDD